MTDWTTLQNQTPRTLQRLQIWKQQVDIPLTPLRKQKFIRPSGRYNGNRPRNQQRHNDGHIIKILHVQRDTIQQPNQRQVDSQAQPNIRNLNSRSPP
jgi:hypothetical protein